MYVGGTGCGLCLTATSAVGKWWPTEPWHLIWTTWSMMQASLAVRYVISCPKGGGGVTCPRGVGGVHMSGGGGTCPRGGLYMLRGGRAGHMIHNLQHCTKAPTTAIGPSPLLITVVHHQQMLRVWNTGSVFVCVCVKLEMILWAQPEEIIWAVYTSFDHLCVFFQSCIHCFGDPNINSFINASIYSFMHPIIHPSIHPLVHSPIPPFFSSFTHSFSCDLLLGSLRIASS